MITENCVIILLCAILSNVEAKQWKSSNYYEVQFQRTNDEPPQAKSLSMHNQKGFLGCLFSESLCGEEEICYNDNLFGQCTTPFASQNSDLNGLNFLTLDQRKLIQTQLLQLDAEGYAWSDAYTQCVLEIITDAISHKRIPMDYENVCKIFNQRATDMDPFFQSQIFGEKFKPGFQPFFDERITDENELVDQELDSSTLLPPVADGDENSSRMENEVSWQPFEDNSQGDFPDEESGILEEPRLEDGFRNLIFDRRERYDVKKPGPFFPNSDNNFFLDKLISASSSNANDNDYLYLPSTSEKEGMSDQGQMEYETPLLAPVKDKKDVQKIKIFPNSNPLPNYVHINLKKRINTWQDGADFIEHLAGRFHLPKHALNDPRIDRQHVSFRVDPNPQNIDAPSIADSLRFDKSIAKALNDDLDMEVDTVTAGNKRDAGMTSKFPVGNYWDYQTLILVVSLASVSAALIVVGFVFFLVKRRRVKHLLNPKTNKDKFSKKNPKIQEEYKELCRELSVTPMKRDSGSSLYEKQPSKESEEGSNSSVNISWATDEPVNMDISTGHMVLAYMEDHLKNKQRLEQEWVGLCGYEADPCTTAVAFKASNKKKNRYPDKLPYDHNRVILNATLNEEESDYINASTVTDHDPRNPSYIVTQGPLSQTVSDFWQMIWEQGCVVIVMLTKLQEQDYTLCHQYWPDEGSETYHIFEVHLVSEHVWCDDYLVRSVYLKNTRTGETRTVTQFHFLSWPAYGIPTSTKALLDFRRKVNKSYRGRSCPITIHCSDGVGRSGTYVLIDMVLNRVLKGCKEIDIAATLEHMRDQRGGIVQTRQQFEFCLMAVAEEVHAILKALPN